MVNCPWPWIVFAPNHHHLNCCIVPGFLAGFYPLFSPFQQPPEHSSCRRGVNSIHSNRAGLTHWAGHAVLGQETSGKNIGVKRYYEG